MENKRATEQLKRITTALQHAQDIKIKAEMDLESRPIDEHFQELTRKLQVLQQLEFNIVTDDDEPQSETVCRKNTSIVDSLEVATVEVERILLS